MEYDETLKYVEKNLYWLNVNARHAIELQETFSFPANDEGLRESIKNTNKVRCYKVCLEAIYFEYVMTIMRMYDSYQRDVMCFQGLFRGLSEEFIKEYELKTNKSIKAAISSVFDNYQKLNGSHLVSGLRKVRHKLYAHTASDFNRNQFGKYGDAEKLLSKSLKLLNSINLAIWSREEPFEKLPKYWTKYSQEFWQNIIKTNN
ncbi:MAG: hypothetical protein ABIJ31_07980 [Pseudomonadota bacterium]